MGVYCTTIKCSTLGGYTIAGASGYEYLDVTSKATAPHYTKLLMMKIAYTETYIIKLIVRKQNTT